jgi:hypothetical protein
MAEQEGRRVEGAAPNVSPPISCADANPALEQMVREIEAYMKAHCGGDVTVSVTRSAVGVAAVAYWRCADIHAGITVSARDAEIHQRHGGVIGDKLRGFRACCRANKFDFKIGKKYGLAAPKRTT